MTKRRAVAIGVGTVAVAAVMGLGFYGARLWSATREMSSLTKVGKAEGEAFRTYRRAGNAEATQALLALAALLEAEESDWTGTPHGKSLAFDLALTYGRLALLSVAPGSHETRERYLGLATAWHKKSGQGVLDTQQLLTLVARVDESGEKGERAAQQ